MRMTIEDATEKARAVVARNPHLDGITDDTRVWLEGDIANAIYSAWHDGRSDGYDAGAAAVGEQWRASIS